VKRLATTGVTVVALVAAAIPGRAHAAPAESSPTAESKPRKEHPPGHGMVVAGAAITVGGIAAYGLFGAGLAIGNRAEQDIASLTGTDDIEARRDLLERGRLGNRLALAGGILSLLTVAVGIPLIVVGRRRAVAASASATRTRVVFGVQGAGAFARISW